MLAGSLIALQFVRSEEIVGSAALTYMDQRVLNAQGGVQSVLLPPAFPTLNTLASLPPLANSTTPGEDTWPILVPLIEELPQIYGIYVGYEDGNFFEVLSIERARAAGAGAELAALNPPPGTAFEVWQIVGAEGQRPEHFVFLG